VLLLIHQQLKELILMSDRTVSVLRTHDDRIVPVLVGKNARIELSVQAIAANQAAVA
jgi:hypothetical protein